MIFLLTRVKSWAGECKWLYLLQGSFLSTRHRLRGHTGLIRTFKTNLFSGYSHFLSGPLTLILYRPYSDIIHNTSRLVSFFPDPQSSRLLLFKPFGIHRIILSGSLDHGPHFLPSVFHLLSRNARPDASRFHLCTGQNNSPCSND